MHWWFQNVGTRNRVRILVFVTPVLFTAAALFLAVEAISFQSAAERTTGRVVHVYDHGDGSYSPVLAYTTSRGEEIDRAGLWVSSGDYDFPLGTELAILSDPDDPWTVRLNDFQSVWGLPATIGAIAVIAWIIALPVWFWARRRLAA